MYISRLRRTHKYVNARILPYVCVYLTKLTERCVSVGSTEVDNFV